jgi:hypothetical protein
MAEQTIKGEKGDKIVRKKPKDKNGEIKNDSEP